tara:strand:- start:1001 stop:1165 length:165 start_codon:yes stop_codon:yes gene_type:complete
MIGKLLPKLFNKPEIKKLFKEIKEKNKKTVLTKNYNKKKSKKYSKTSTGKTLLT